MCVDVSESELVFEFESVSVGVKEIVSELVNE